MNLIEVTASTILVALILLGSVQATTGMLGNQVAADAHLQADWYADELLAEIITVPFSLTADDRASTLSLPIATVNLSTGDIPVQLRSGIAELSDFDGWSQSPPTSIGGVALPRLAGWSAAVTVSDVDPASPDTAVTIAESETSTLRRVHVTMSDPDGNAFTRTALVSPYTRSSGLEGTIDSLGRVQWQMSSVSESMTVPLSNFPGR